MLNTKDFMTKTIAINRDNGVPNDDVFPVAIDIGYSAVKVFSPNTVAMFPSYAVRDNNNGTAGTLSEDYIRYEDLETGEKWFVGKMAQDGLSDDDTAISESSLYGRDRYRDPMFRIITETGIGMALLRKKPYDYRGRTICIETGLPPKYISKGSPDCRDLTDALAGHHHFALTIGQKPPVEIDVEIEAKDIHIMPQPMGTLFSVAVGADHRLIADAVNYFNKNVLIFDGGFGTLDFYPIKAHVIQNSETYPNLGMKRVLEETAGMIRDSYQKDISVPAMQKYLERGAFRWFEPRTIATKDEPLGDILEQASQKVCEEAIQKMLQVYRLYEYDYLIVTGGTGAAWYDQIKAKLQNMETLKIIAGAQNDDLPGVFANVRGYYMYRYSDIAQRS